MRAFMWLSLASSLVNGLYRTPSKDKQISMTSSSRLWRQRHHTSGGYCPERRQSLCFKLSFFTCQLAEGFCQEEYEFTINESTNCQSQIADCS